MTSGGSAAASRQGSVPKCVPKRLNLRQAVTHPAIIAGFRCSDSQADFRLRACKRGTIAADHVGGLGRRKQTIELLCSRGDRCPFRAFFAGSSPNLQGCRLTCLTRGSLAHWTPLGDVVPRIWVEFTRNACIQVESSEGGFPVRRRPPRPRSAALIDRRIQQYTDQQASRANLDPRTIARRPLAPRATAIPISRISGERLSLSGEAGSGRLAGTDHVTGTDRVAGSGLPVFALRRSTVRRSRQPASGNGGGGHFLSIRAADSMLVPARRSEARGHVHAPQRLAGIDLGHDASRCRLAVRRARATADDLLHLRSGAHQLAGNLFRAIRCMIS